MPNTRRKSPPPSPSIEPALAKVRERSVGPMDDLQLEILRQAQDALPAAPVCHRECLGIAA